MLRCAGLALLLVAASAQAQTATKPAAPAPSGPTLHIEGSFRARLEGIDGQFRPKIDDSIAFTSFRTLVAAKIDWDDLTIGGELMDARGYGEGHNSSVKASEINTLEPLQAYASYKLHNLFGKKDSLAATIGRFTMTFGAQRLVARADFGNTFPSYLGGAPNIAPGTRTNWSSSGRGRSMRCRTRRTRSSATRSSWITSTPARYSTAPMAISPMSATR